MRWRHEPYRSLRSARPLHLEVLEDRCLLSTYTLTDLGTLPGGSDIFAQGLNNLGQVVGHVVGPALDRAFLWDSGTMTALDTLGGDHNEAYSINDLGQVTGWSDVTPGDRYTHHAFLWDSANGMQDLWKYGVFFNFAGALNNAGEVLGLIDPLHNGYAYLWNIRDGQVTDLCPRDRGCAAAAINNLGQVAGSKVFDFDEHAALRNADGSWQDLGTLSGPGIGYAHGLNDVGQVVGEDNVLNHAFLWQDGVMTDLDPKHGNVATAINNAGQVVGLGGGSIHFVWLHLAGWRYDGPKYSGARGLRPETQCGEGNQRCRPDPGRCVGCQSALPCGVADSRRRRGSAPGR
jgi:probable HAF family extracellular repeat protein